MNGQGHCRLHSNKSHKPLCLITLQRGLRLNHPSEVLCSSLCMGISHPRHAMWGFTCPLPTLNSLPIFFSLISGLLPSLQSCLSIGLFFLIHHFFSMQLVIILPLFLTHLLLIPFIMLFLFIFFNKHLLLWTQSTLMINAGLIKCWFQNM